MLTAMQIIRQISDLTTDRFLVSFIILFESKPINKSSKKQRKKSEILHFINIDNIIIQTLKKLFMEASIKKQLRNADCKQT